MVNAPARHGWAREGRDAVAAAAAPGTAQRVDREGRLEDLGPAPALWFDAGVGFGLALSLDGAAAWRATWSGTARPGTAGPRTVDQGAAGHGGIPKGKAGARTPNSVHR